MLEISVAVLIGGYLGRRQWISLFRLITVYMVRSEETRWFLNELRALKQSLVDEFVEKK
ncbi:hypothetical protein [Vibrio sp.]|uniref:hypothetical protein n=1 Tax=Vibrio sp. TaxID=678 RepID=UPI003D0B926C